LPSPTIFVIAPRQSHRRHGAPARVRHVVADLARAAGHELRIKQSDVALAAGCTRETASRELARLERAGVVEQHRGRIIVLRTDALDAEDET